MTDNPTEQTNQTQQVIAALKLHPDMMPMDPGCDYIKHFAVNKGVQGVLHIDGSDSLIYLVNPDDGREPYIVIRGPEPSMMMTTKLHREGELNDIESYQRYAGRHDSPRSETEREEPSGEAWEKLDELVSSLEEEDYDDD